jgi:hypothetical protein
MSVNPSRVHPVSSVAAEGEQKATAGEPTEGWRAEGAAAAAAEEAARGESHTSGSSARRQLHSSKRGTHVATLSANLTEASTGVLRLVFNAQPTEALSEPVLELTTVASDNDRAVVHTRVAAAADGAPSSLSCDPLVRAGGVHLAHSPASTMACHAYD